MGKNRLTANVLAIIHWHSHAVGYGRSRLVTNYKEAEAAEVKPF